MLYFLLHFLDNFVVTTIITLNKTIVLEGTEKRKLDLVYLSPLIARWNGTILVISGETSLDCHQVIPKKINDILLKYSEKKKKTWNGATKKLLVF